MVNHDGENIMVWGCFPASGSGQLTVSEGSLNFKLHQNIMEKNICVAVHHLKLNRS
ncbi:hypothetical protein LDENG_00174060 [Lucifuga dentata]|nr:hypothetical protein LDENG_00174060 [Lucifuga dentata]